VCVEPTLGCLPRGIEPVCPRCAVGEFGACENFGAAGEGRYNLPAGTSIGYNNRTGGSWGEFFIAHQCQLVEVPSKLTDAQAVLTDPIACSMHGVLRTDLTDVQNICIYGGGILGLATVAALRAVGYTGRIDMFARHAFQRELAGRLGATMASGESDAKNLEAMAQHLGGHVVRARFGNHMLMGGYDAVYCCVSSPAAITLTLKLTRARGQVILLGTSAAHEIDTTPIWFRELTLSGAYGRQIEHWGGEAIGTYQLVHRWILDGTIPTEGLLTHTFPLADYRHAFAAATRKGRSACVRAAFSFT
jgi:threonine dehydrogenase-like Zn-dependent dehydrogenase